MGFSLLHPTRAELALPTSVYFAHSYACRPVDPSVVLAETTLEGDTFPAIVRTGNCVGFQFHPEKSSHEGVELLTSFAKRICS
jgi:glutamine amidotransferase